MHDWSKSIKFANKMSNVSSKLQSMGKLRLIIFTALLCVATSSWGESGMVLLLKDGSTAGFLFSEKPTVVTSTSVLTMRTANGYSVEYAYDKVRRIYFSDNVNSTGIKVLETGSNANVTFRLTPTGIEIMGLEKGNSAAVYTIDGRLVAKGKAEGGKTSLAIPQGGKAYIVRTSTGVSYKLVKP